jgi:vitamin B12 transporter
MQKLLFTSIALLLSPCYAANNIITQPEVVVTATRSAKTLGEQLASVTVFNRQQIEQSQATTLPELLRTAAGVNIVSYGGLGQTASVFLRGTNSDHVLVLIDGVKIGSATLGTAPLQDIPLNQVERVEIVRGPRSSLYGSEAIGGVIQIFTRRGKHQPQANSSVGFGSHSTYQASAGASGQDKTRWINFQADYLRSKGTNACQSGVNAGCFAEEPDRDGYHNTSLTFRLGETINQRLSAEIYALRQHGNTQYDSMGNNELDFTQQLYGLKTNVVANDNWLMNFNLSQQQDEQNNVGHEIPDAFYNTKRTAFDWQNQWTLSPTQSVIFGYNYQKEQLDSSLAYTGTQRDNHALFAEYQRQLGAFDVLLGVRRDDNQQFGKHLTGNAALGYTLSKATKLFLSYGTAFKAPSFNQLYYPGIGGFQAYGNPDLNPETSKSWELGLNSNYKQFNWGVNLYQTKVTDLIGGYPAQNINKARIKGAEFLLNINLDRWTLQSNISWLNPKNTDTDKLLPRRAEQVANLALSRLFHFGSVTAELSAQSQRYDDVANNTALGGYGVLNLRSEYRFTKNWLLRARIDNAFDKTYETVKYYAMPGRSFMLQVVFEKK